jgi:hypothetical protein
MGDAQARSDPILLGCNFPGDPRGIGMADYEGLPETKEELPASLRARADLFESLKGKDIFMTREGLWTWV